MDPVLILLIMQACDYSREVFTLTFVNKLVNKYNNACYLLRNRILWCNFKNDAVRNKYRYEICYFF